jgi:hypothetical protein
LITTNGHDRLVAVGSALLLGSLLLQDGLLDALAAWQRDSRLSSLAQHKDVSLAGSKHVASSVLGGHNVERPRVLLDVLDDSHTPCVASTGDHAQVTNLVPDDVCHLACLEVHLDRVVHLCCVVVVAL